MNYISDIPYKVDKSAIHGVEGTGANIFNAVVEISNGDNVKYEVHPTGTYLTAVRSLNPIFNYPFSYGYIPRTLAEDGDCVDVIIITPQPLAHLSVIEVRLLGYVPTTDDGKRDDKLIAVPAYSSLKRVSMDKVMAFLKNYKYPDNAQSVVGEYVQDSAKAEAIVEEAHSRYLQASEPQVVEVLEHTPDIAPTFDDIISAPVISAEEIKPQEPLETFDTPTVVEAKPEPQVESPANNIDEGWLT